MRVDEIRFRWNTGLRVPLLLLVMASMAGCAAHGVNALDVEEQDSFLPLASGFTSLSDPACRDSFSGQVASVLVKQGETLDVAKGMAADLLDALLDSPRPGPFYAFSPAGIRYGFIAQSTESGCVLRLYQRQRRLAGSTRVGVMDTIDYLDTRTVLYCSCGENVDWAN
jgi:hypothetical protein